MTDYSIATENDFLLPQKDQPFLPGTKNSRPEFYLGLPGWTYGGSVNSKPADPKPGTLPFYAGYFNAVELNSTFQSIPRTEDISKWYRSVKDKELRICAQLPQDISHIGKIGIQKTGPTNEFVARIKGLNDKLGNSFIDMPDTYTWNDKESLLAYFKALPADFELSVGINNNGWLSNAGQVLDFAAALNPINKGLMINDKPACREGLHMQLSTTTAFIRFYCAPHLEVDMFRIEQWKKQLRSWYLQGLKRCYFFLHIDNKDEEAEFAEYVKHELNF